MSAIKFRKRLTKFKITITLPKKFGSKGFITVVKVINISRSSGESNVEICIPHMRYASPSRKGKLTISKSSYTYIGDVTAPVLRVVPFQQTKSDIHSHKEFLNLHYVSVAKSFIDQVHINIKGDTGYDVPFITGKSLIKLHFRLKENLKKMKTGASYPVYRGIPRQYCHGLGSIFKTAIRTIVPILKPVAKAGLRSAKIVVKEQGISALRDMVSEQNVKQVLQRRGQAALKQILPIKSKRSSRKSHSFAKHQRVNKTGKSKSLSIKDIEKKFSGQNIFK